MVDWHAELEGFSPQTVGISRPARVHIPRDEDGEPLRRTVVLPDGTKWEESVATQNESWDGVREIFAPGLPAESLYLLTGGLVEMGTGVGDGDGSTPFLDWVMPDDIFGEVELFAAPRRERDRTDGEAIQLRLTGAWAVTPCSLLAYRFEDLRRSPRIMELLARRCAVRYAGLAQRMVGVLAQAPAVALAATLCDLVERLAAPRGGLARKQNVAWIDQDIPQDILGRAMGKSRSLTSTAVSSFVRANLLYKNGDQKLCLLAIDRLRALAEPSRAARAEDARLEAIDRLIDEGQFFRARNTALELLEVFPESLAVRYRVVLACARAGALDEATRLCVRFGFDRPIEEIDAAFDAETERRGREREGAAEPQSSYRRRHMMRTDIAVLAARLDKDRAFASRDPAARRRLLDDARARYEASRGGDFPLINVAALSLMLGEPDAARAHARALLKPRIPPYADYWMLITRAEAHLMLGEVDNAVEMARLACEARDAGTGKRASTRLQLRRLRGSLPTADIDAVIAAVPVPVSTVYSAHMMRASTHRAGEQQDHAERAKAALSRLEGPRHAFGALACGGDIIIAEWVLANGGQLHVVLPMRIPDFIELSVLPGDREADRDRDSGWLRGFERCLGQASSISFVHAGETQAWERDACFEAAFRVAAGLSLISADQLCGEARMLTIFDGGAVTSVAGTAMAVETAEAAGLPVEKVPCSWRQPSAGKREARRTPFRPVILVWRPDPAGKGKRKGKAKGAGKVPLVLDLPKGVDAQQFPLDRRDVEYSGAAIVCADVPTALGLAFRVPRVAGDKVMLDFGAVLDRRLEVAPKRLTKLTGGAGPLEVPPGVVVASEIFAAEARLSAPGLMGFEPMGVCGAPARKAGEVTPEPSPLPSLPLYRLVPPDGGTLA